MPIRAKAVFVEKEIMVWMYILLKRVCLIYSAFINPCNLGLFKLPPEESFAYERVSRYKTHKPTCEEQPTPSSTPTRP